jgi:coenzyme F420-reducing hydrogenase alpha subunit
VVDEPKPKNAGRRRRTSVYAPLTIKEKKARKSAQDMLREKKKELEKAQKNFWATKNKLKEIDEVFDGKKQIIEEDKIEEASPNIKAALKDKEVIFEPNDWPTNRVSRIK